MQHGITHIILALMSRFLGGPAAAGKFQRGGRIVLLLISLWFVLSALIWADAGGRTLTVLDAIAAGAPTWVLILPLTGLLSMVLLWRHPPGLYWLLGYGGFIVIAIAFAVTIATDDTTGISPSWGPGVSVALSFVYCILALIMALGEPVPLDSPIAHVAYLGMVGHLRSVRRLGEKLGWPVKGPEGPLHMVHMEGSWGERDAGIASGTHFSFTSSDSYHFLHVTVFMPRKARPFFLGVGGNVPGAPGKAEQALALSGTCQTAGRKPATFYVWSARRSAEEQAAVRRLTPVLDAGRRFLRNRTVVVASDHNLVFDRRSTWRMTEQEDDIEAIVRWLNDIARTMEDTGLVSEDDT